MPRRRKRRWKPNWAPILGLALAGNVLAGIWLSPITSIRRIRIEGAPTWDRPRIQTEVAKLKDRPSVPVNPRELETRILAHPAVASVDFRRSIFGSARLELTYRRPIARLSGTDGQFLDREGGIFRFGGRLTADLPTIRLHASSLRPAMTLMGAWPAAKVADLIPQIPKSIPIKGLDIEVDSEGAVCLNIKQAARIDLGSVDRLSEKFRALEGLLAENPDLLQKVEELNLVEPTRPAMRPRRGAQP